MFKLALDRFWINKRFLGLSHFNDFSLFVVQRKCRWDILDIHNFLVEKLDPFLDKCEEGYQYL